MRFEFIAKHRGIWPVSWICEALGVSRSGFHAWLVRAPSKRARSDEEFGARVRASFISSYRTYGVRRVWHDLLAEGLSCGLHRIERLMRVHGLRIRPRRRGLPKDDGLRSVIADNTLDRLLHRGGAQPEVNRRLHLHLDGRRVAPRRCRHRPVLAPRGRMVDEQHHDRSARDRCADDGDLATRKARPPAASLGPGQPIHERAVPAVDGRQWRHLLDEPVGQRLGQRGNGKFLLVDEDRTDRPEDIERGITRRRTCSIISSASTTRHAGTRRWAISAPWTSSGKRM